MDEATGRAVALEDATVAFRLADARLYTAVEKARLSVAQGEFVAIVGPTGCGKSTLLNVAAGLLRPASGTVRIFDRPLVGLNRDSGYLFQADALFPWKTALDNVAIGLEIAGTPRKEALARALGWLASVGLEAFAGRYPHMLSGGQRKRVGLAQVLIRDPKILLMDEPFGPLDAQTRQIMGNLLLDLWNADRKAVLFVTHDLRRRSRLPIVSSSCRRGLVRKSSATGAFRWRARATFSKPASARNFTPFTARYGACSRLRC